MIAKPQTAIRNRYLKTTKKVGVLGGGSWATALVKLLTENKRNVHWYMRSESAKLLGINFKTSTLIIDAVYAILYEGKSPAKTFIKLSKKLN